MNGVQILLIVGVGIAVSAVARKRGVEPGMIIVVLAAAASFIPGVPRLELESEFILAIVIPPLLYSATRGASFANFGANLRAIWSLGVVLVLLTTGALGLLSSWLLPTVGLAVAFVLGAVLAPPDTITTVSHGEEIGLPRRATSILTGESLVNDATALTLFSIAIAAVNGEHTTWQGGVLEFIRTAGIGLGIGAGFAVVALWIRKRLGNPTLETALVLLVPFTAFLAAEEAHASGILAVVSAAFSLSVNLTLDPKHQYPGGLPDAPAGAGGVAGGRLPARDLRVRVHRPAVEVCARGSGEVRRSRSGPHGRGGRDAAGGGHRAAAGRGVPAVRPLDTARPRHAATAQGGPALQGALRTGSANAGVAGSRCPRPAPRRRCWSAGPACAAS